MAKGKSKSDELSKETDLGENDPVSEESSDAEALANNQAPPTEPGIYPTGENASVVVRGSDETLSVTTLTPDHSAGNVSGHADWVVHTACAGRGCDGCDGKGLVPPA